ncbi:MAG: UPF0179 family protein [Thermoplasmatota archaeon]
MAQVTLIGERIAEKDLIFTYQGHLEECRNCKLKNICFNLKQYQRYRIKKVRNKRHSCSVHDGDVVVVEVEKLPLLAAIEKKYSKGSKITMKKRDCEMRSCEFFDLCMSKATQENKKYKIKTVLEPISCEKGYDLQKVELKE